MLCQRGQILEARALFVASTVENRPSSSFALPYCILNVELKNSNHDKKQRHQYKDRCIHAAHDKVGGRFQQQGCANSPIMEILCGEISA